MLSDGVSTYQKRDCVVLAGGSRTDMGVQKRTVRSSVIMIVDLEGCLGLFVVSFVDLRLRARDALVSWLA